MGILSKSNSQMCWGFWNEAGLSARDVISVLPIAAKRLQRTLPVLQFVEAGPGKKAHKKSAGESLVAVPFLQVVAAAGKERGTSVHDLIHAKFDHVIAAPKLWCPNPTQTVSMRVKGDSMEPTLFGGYTIVVDQAQTQESKLDQQIVVAHHDKFGLVVSRFWHFKKASLLVSDNRKHVPVPMSAEWSIVGKVLWWIGEAGEVKK
jgi:SOS-response transcriptional repressor LexA